MLLLRSVSFCDTPSTKETRAFLFPIAQSQLTIFLLHLLLFDSITGLKPSATSLNQRLTAPNSVLYANSLLDNISPFLI